MCGEILVYVYRRAGVIGSDGTCMWLKHCVCASEYVCVCIYVFVER